MLQKLNIINFNTSNVDYMNFMFSECKSLEKINLSNFDTSKVEYMDGMFNKCFSLNKLDLSNFNTNRIINMRKMFKGCRSLKELNLSNFNIINSNGIDIVDMFLECPSLKNLICSDKIIKREFECIINKK